MPFPPRDHDHESCRREALAAAEAECRRRGARLTPIRRRVLELVWASHSAVGAYALLDALARQGGPVAPPTIYRALDFLLSHGLIHRVELKNAYIGCRHPGHPQCGVVVLCPGCGAAAEDQDAGVEQAIAALVERLGVAPGGRRAVEIEALCPHCQNAEPPR
jgi:Fur family zinc uptake transcriptional regulator